MANILMFFLSNYPRKEYEKELYYKYKEAVEQATQTNMGPARSLVASLDGKLDKIIYLASDSVRIKKEDVRFESEFMNWFHEKWNRDLEKNNSKLDVIFEKIEVSDDFRDDEIMNYVIKMVREIKPEDHVFIDFSGGFRQAAFAFLTVSKILTYKGITNITILTAHYTRGIEYSQENPMLIEENKSVSQGMDYVGATQIFLKTGDITELGKWFLDNEKNLNHWEDEIIECFKRFYKSILLCQVKTTVECWEEILKNLKEYQNKELEQVTPSFKNVVDLFLIKMSKEEENSFFSLIRWCINHDLLQQALTIFDEKIPETLGFEKRNDFMYKWPEELKSKEDKASYYKHYESLKSKLDKGEIKEEQCEFKIKYLLLNSIRNHANHASEDEKANEINKFLMAIPQKYINVNQNNINDVGFSDTNNENNICTKMSDLSYIKRLILDVLDHFNIYKDAFDMN